MNATHIVLLVLGILAVQVAIWLPIIAWLRRRARQVTEALERELAADTVVLGPTRASYRGSSSGHSRVKGDGVIALTERRLVFAALTGGRVELPLSQLVGVREDRWFLRSYRGGRQHLIVQLDAGEVGFMVEPHAAWIKALRERVDVTG